MRKIGIATSEDAREVLTDKYCKEVITQKIAPNFKAEKFYLGITEGINALVAKWN